MAANQRAQHAGGPGEHPHSSARLPHAAPVTPAARDVARDAGAPLEPPARAAMEARFAHDFGQVRVHDDARADASARAVRARAYTLGEHVVFRRGEYEPRGDALLAHELTHVIEQRAAGEPAVLQRQEEGQQVPGQGGAPQPQPDGAAPLQAGQAQAAPAPAQRPWTPQMPYIWFDLHDLFRAGAAPEGPYLYSSRAYVDRTLNPNFQNDLNPGPARSLPTHFPGGMPAQRNDLRWEFQTKFFVDEGDAHLPAAYTRFETSADIRYVPSGGGAGFSYQFVDNNPRYTSPGTLSYPFMLTTSPWGFRANDFMSEPGTLQWDARLLVAKTDDRVPLLLDYTAAPGVGDEAAFRAEIARLGVRVRPPAAGEQTRRTRVSYTPDGADTSTVVIEYWGADGQLQSERRITRSPRNIAADVAALVVAMALDATAQVLSGGSTGARHVEIHGSQRVAFARPTSP